MKFDKAAIINGMCMTFNHSYGIMDDKQRKFLFSQMSSIFEHNVEPILEQITANEKELEILRANLGNAYRKIQDQKDSIASLKKRISTGEES